MKPLMKPIDTPDQVFHDGDPSTGELGTICSAEWLNDTQASIRDIQAECITILKANGFEPDETKRDQLWEAIQAAIKNHVPAASLLGAGIVQLSSSVTSDSETTAATSKAVKIAMDNGNARMAKDRNGSDIPNKALFRQNLELGNSAILNVGTTINTVAAGDDVRITGAMQKGMNGSDIPDKAAFCRALGLGALATSDSIDALIKSQNGADIPDKTLFVQNLGLKETLNPTKRVSIGNIGTDMFDGRLPCINIGDSDSGFIGSADGVLDIYCNNAKTGYIDNAGLHMLAGIATNKDLVLQSDERRHIMMQNADGSVRAYIYKDKDDTGIHINNGVDGSGDFVLGKDSILYVPYAVRAGGSKKLAIQSDNNSALNATFNLWGNANKPTVIELDDDQGWHLYSQRNPDGSVLFKVNGDINANRNLNAGSATVATDGNVNGSVWGGWLNDWINNNFVRDVRMGTNESGIVWGEQGGTLPAGYVLTGGNFDDDREWPVYAPVQKNINGTWYNVTRA
ncbi:tail fiber protein [Salmonella enterica subsp. diarizonae]